MSIGDLLCQDRDQRFLLFFQRQRLRRCSAQGSRAQDQAQGPAHDLLSQPKAKIKKAQGPGPWGLGPGPRLFFFFGLGPGPGPGPGPRAFLSSILAKKKVLWAQVSAHTPSLGWPIGGPHRRLRCRHGLRCSHRHVRQTAAHLLVGCLSGRRRHLTHPAEEGWLGHYGIRPGPECRRMLRCCLSDQRLKRRAAHTSRKEVPSARLTDTRMRPMTETAMELPNRANWSVSRRDYRSDLWVPLQPGRLRSSDAAMPGA